MENKPSLLIIDVERKRDPLQWEFYNHLMRDDSPLNIKLSNKTNSHVKDSVAEIFNGEAPDFILSGIEMRKAIDLSHNYIKQKRIRLITTVADVESFINHDGTYRPFIRTPLDFVFTRYYPTKNLETFIRKEKHQRGTKIIGMPWGHVQSDKEKVLR